MSRRWIARSGWAAVFVLASCGGGDTAAPGTIPVSDGNCGDIDGLGSDTGNVPDVTGSWTASFASSLGEDDCQLPGTLQESFPWLNSPIEIGGGAPANLRLEFGSLDEQLKGIEAAGGGMVFSGQADSPSGRLHIAIGGLVYTDAYTNRDTWDGMAFIGVDQNEDGSIDCTVRGDFTALKST